MSLKRCFLDTFQFLCFVVVPLGAHEESCVRETRFFFSLVFVRLTTALPEPRGSVSAPFLFSGFSLERGRARANQQCLFTLVCGSFTPPS